MLVASEMRIRLHEARFTWIVGDEVAGEAGNVFAVFISGQVYQGMALFCIRTPEFCHLLANACTSYFYCRINLRSMGSAGSCESGVLYMRRRHRPQRNVRLCGRSMHARLPNLLAKCGRIVE